MILFFALVFLFSVPFFVLGGMTDLQLTPGLSVSALAVFGPVAAALVFVHLDKNSGGMVALLKRSVDFKRIKSKRWLVPVLLLMPTVSLVVYGLMRFMDMPLPAAQFNLLSALLMFIAFFVGGLGEELGWTGYALDPMQERWGDWVPACFWGWWDSCGTLRRCYRWAAHPLGLPGGPSMR